MNYPQNFGHMYSGQMPVPPYPTLPPGNAAIPQPAAEVMASPSPVRSPFTELNPATLCKIGQETVSEIIERMEVIFKNLKLALPPNGSMKGANDAQSRKLHFQENLRHVVLMMRRLRLVYQTCNDVTKNLEMSLTTAESLVPLKDEWDGKSDERKQSEAYRTAVAERAVLREQVNAVNREIKEVLDLQRRSIWEINCQLSMVRS